MTCITNKERLIVLNMFMIQIFDYITKEALYADKHINKEKLSLQKAK